MEKITDFKHNPKLRKMLVNYCIRIYGEDAITDDKHLLDEYYLLISYNELYRLIDEDFFKNYLNDGEFRG